MVGDQQPSRALVLQAADQSFDDRDAAVLADRAEALLDLPTGTPPLEPLVGELRAVVGDDVLGCRPRSASRSTEERPDRTGGRLAVEDRKAHDAPGVVIDDHGNPPAKRPPLR